MQWNRWRSLVACLLIGAAPACDLNLSGLDNLGLPNPPGGPSGPQTGSPPLPLARPAISIEVQPKISDSLSQAFGTIREGSYIDTLKVHWTALRDPARTVLVAGYDSLASPRSGMYAVTIAAPGYATWDTTGVRVDVDSAGVGQTVSLSVRLTTVP
jgi:hypothetical protein